MGEPENAAQAKEIVAGYAGTYVTMMVETQGLDYIDPARAKHEAKGRIESAIDS